MRFMIVDDHKAMRRLIRTIILSVFGNTAVITECESGEAAIESFPEFKPYCVLMDIELTGMDGFETIEKIFKQAPDVKVIMITGYNDPIFRKKAEDLDLAGFVFKDRLSDLIPVLEQLRQ